MSHRTEHLPEVSGLRHVVREMRHKESARQILGFVFVLLVTALGTPQLPLAYAGIPLILAGVVVRMWASGHIMKNSVLATNGPYSLVRHPLYTGNILLLVGFAIVASQLWGYLLLAAFLLFYYPTAIRYEDYKLEQLFADQWRAWSANTPALLPRRLWSKDITNAEWSLINSMDRNKEPVIAIVLLTCLIVLFLK
ncbi:MAG: isoprenylcysteine carboxylmethyltransferase family protein [Gammaproteobacteria bacterium]|nr:isoprenylcysteine carboxylmethyltransferase family protein [Gammaproteobacteria bacterium]